MALASTFPQRRVSCMLTAKISNEQSEQISHLIKIFATVILEQKKDKKHTNPARCKTIKIKGFTHANQQRNWSPHTILPRCSLLDVIMKLPSAPGYGGVI